jgi:hypothetical protein
MKNTNEVERLCNGLVSNFSFELLKIAAEKQLAVSTIAAANKTEAERDQLSAVMGMVINKRTIDAGFTIQELDQALRGIYLAGEALRHLSIIHEPITDHAASTGERVLKQVMYPCDQKPENFPYGLALELSATPTGRKRPSLLRNARKFACRHMTSNLSFKIQVLATVICANYSVRIFMVFFGSKFLA